MAYLKGGTVVDGNLYIEGGLRVKQIVDSSGKSMPHLEDESSSVPNRVVKFTDTNAAIRYTLIEESYTSSGGVEQISFKDWGNETLSSLILKMNNLQFISLSKQTVSDTLPSLKLGDSSGIKSVDIHAGYSEFHMPPDKVIVEEKRLQGIVADPSGLVGTIILNGDTSMKYRLSNNYVTDPPTAFIYYSGT